MAISDLIAKRKREEELGPLFQVTFRLNDSIVASADELAAELGATRSDVLRDFCEEGWRRVMSEWQRAGEEAFTDASS